MSQHTPGPWVVLPGAAHPQYEGTPLQITASNGYIATMQPGDFTDLRPDDNGRDVHGHVVTKDGTVSPYPSLVATTYGTAAIRQKTANRIVLGPKILAALKAEHASAVRQAEEFRCNQGCTVCQLIDHWEKGTIT